MARKKSGLERIVGGLTTGAVVYGLWAFHVFPQFTGLLIAAGILFGALPVLSGIRRVAREIADRSHSRHEAIAGRQTLEVERRDSLEKTVLQIARERRGIVSPALVVLHSDMKLEEAEKVLGDLAARGYAEMRIKDNGTIDYVFHDLA